MGNNDILSNKLLLSADKMQLSLLLTPDEHVLDAARLIDYLQTSEYADLKLNMDGVNQAIQMLRQLRSGHHCELESIVIAERLDAQLSITIDAEMMLAKAQVVAAYGGLSIGGEQLHDSIAELNISHGINQKAFTSLIEKSQNAKPGSAFQVTIAQGTPPVNGTDASFNRLVKTPKERILKPAKTEGGRVDMHNLGELITVQADCELMRKIPYIEGSSGITVTGDTVPYIAGKDFALIAGEHTKICDNDENLLIATLPGIPKTLDNGMQVDDVLLINNVNVGYGNVDYKGGIIIEGDICDGMKVSSSGDITVSGFIESANVECGGDLIVGKGILGRKSGLINGQFSCEVKCKGSVIANFSQYSKMTVGMDLQVKTQLLHCHVDCQGGINVVDDFGSKGSIVGGFLRSRKGVNSVTIGATAGSKTIIDLVGLYPKIVEEKEQNNLSIIDAQNQLTNLRVAKRKIELLPNSEKKQSLHMRVVSTEDEVAKQLTSLENAFESNNAELMLYFKNAHVITKKELHSDVIISIGRDTFRSQRNYGPTKVSVIDYKLSVEPYQN